MLLCGPLPLAVGPYLAVAVGAAHHYPVGNVDIATVDVPAGGNFNWKAAAAVVCCSCLGC